MTDRARRARYGPWLLVALIVAFVVAIRVPLLGVPLERDEGEYAYAGQLMLQGIAPYKLAVNMKFPGTYGAYAAIMAVFGQTIVGIHIGFLLVNAATVVMIWLLGRRLFGTAAGVAAAAAYALLSVGAGVNGTQAHATHFVVLFAVPATLLLLRAFDTGRPSTLFWSGLLYGAGILMKQHGVFLAAFGGLALLWTQRAAGLAVLRRAALFAAGVCAPLAFTVLALWRAGVIDRFWFWTVTYAREYVTETPLSVGREAFRFGIRHAVVPALPIWLAAALGLVLIWREKEERAQALFTTGLLVFSFVAMCPGLYFRLHYFVLILPAVALLAGAVVASASRLFPRAVWSYGLFAALLAFSVFQQRAFLFTMDPPEVSRAMYGTSPFPEAIEIAAYIRAHSAEGSTIAVLGSEPEIPFYAGRHSATGYLYTYPLMENQLYAPVMQDEMIREIEASRPEYVVFVTHQGSWVRRPDSDPHIFEWWDEYRVAHYKIIGVADIVWPDPTEYRWEELEKYQPRSPVPVMVYRRTGP